MARLAPSRATDLLGCSLPIVLAGMGGVSRSELVAAVTAAGGFGFLGMVREPATLIWQEVESLRQSGYSNFGVNIIPAATDRILLDRQIETLIELHVPVVALFWDIDAGVVSRFRDAGITVVYQVGSVSEAIAAERAGVELIIAQGVEAGGHVRGSRPLCGLLPETVAAVKVPVLGAGGLATGGDLLTALALGADGIVLGTAFLATDESFAHEDHKRHLLTAGPADTVLTDTFRLNWPPGAPVRVLKSDVTTGRRELDTNELRIIGDEEGRPIYLFSTDSPLRSMTGDFGAMALYAGTGVGNIREIVSANTRIHALVAEAERLLIATEVPVAAEYASTVCYAGEMSGAYMGTLVPDELIIALREVSADLLHVLRGALAESSGRAIDGPPFTDDVYPLAAWTLTLRGLAGGEASLPAPPADLPKLLQRLGAFVPRMPDSALRDTMLALRRLLEERSASQLTKTLQVRLPS